MKISAFPKLATVAAIATMGGNIMDTSAQDSSLSKEEAKSLLPKAMNALEQVLQNEKLNPDGKKSPTNKNENLEKIESPTKKKQDILDFYEAKYGKNSPYQKEHNLSKELQYLTHIVFEDNECQKPKSQYQHKSEVKAQQGTNMWRISQWDEQWNSVTPENYDPQNPTNDENHNDTGNHNDENHNTNDGIGIGIPLPTNQCLVSGDHPRSAVNNITASDTWLPTFFWNKFFRGHEYNRSWKVTCLDSAEEGGLVDYPSESRSKEDYEKRAQTYNNTNFFKKNFRKDNALHHGDLHLSGFRNTQKAFKLEGFRDTKCYFPPTILNGESTKIETDFIWRTKSVGDFKWDILYKFPVGECIRMSSNLVYNGIHYGVGSMMFLGCGIDNIGVNITDITDRVSSGDNDIGNIIDSNNNSGDNPVDIGNISNINATKREDGAKKESVDITHVGEDGAEMNNINTKIEEATHANGEEVTHAGNGEDEETSEDDVGAKKEEEEVIDGAKKEEEKEIMFFAGDNAKKEEGKSAGDTNGEKVDRFAGDADRFAGGGVMVDPPLLARKRKDKKDIAVTFMLETKMYVTVGILVILIVTGVVCYFKTVSAEKSVCEGSSYFEGQSAGESVSERSAGPSDTNSHKIGLSLSKRALPESVPEVCDSV